MTKHQIKNLQALIKEVMLQSKQNKQARSVDFTGPWNRLDKDLKEFALETAAAANFINVRLHVEQKNKWWLVTINMTGDNARMSGRAYEQTLDKAVMRALQQISDGLGEAESWSSDPYQERRWNPAHE